MICCLQASTRARKRGLASMPNLTPWNRTMLSGSLSGRDGRSSFAHAASYLWPGVSLCGRSAKYKCNAVLSFIRWGRR